ncbi:hypothetical protein LBMAG42_48170 [Deltaproteobacteria bacterium]|nr:hypothetical protein LBMAG42_48170 [Deltaproteobacteria bacterium]
MSTFSLPSDIVFNRGRVEDAAALAAETRAASWLLLTGDEFTAMGGLSYAEVQRTISRSENVPSDPPRTLDLNHARQHVAALDALPRPTLVTCRMGPRSSAAAYMYAGLRAGADADDVIMQAQLRDAPFVQSAECIAWVRSSIEALRAEEG